MSTPLHPKILRALEKKGWKELTPPQIMAIEPVLSGKNVLIIAPTGSGKTEAVMLPIFHKIMCDGGDGILALYITPLRALNRDLIRRLEYFSSELGITMAVRHGDTSKRERIRQSMMLPQLLITTPETFQILFTGKRLREGLKKVKYLVVDEVHELFGSERGAQLSVAIARLEHYIGRHVQKIGLSATIGNAADVSKFLGDDVVIIDVAGQKKMEVFVDYPDVMQDDEEMGCASEVRAEDLCAMRMCLDTILSHKATLFFVNTRDTAEVLGAKYSVIFGDVPIAVHHGSLSKDIRVDVENRFKNGELKAIICTSSLELGIDVGHADYVIQYNSPRQVSRLVQRLGRAGHRLNEVSRGMIIATNPDDLMEAAVIARRALEGEIEDCVQRACPLTVLANQIAAMSIAECRDLTDAFHILRSSHTFRNLSKDVFRRVCDMLASAGLLRRERSGRKTYEYFYNNISMIPDEKMYEVHDVVTGRTVGVLDEDFVVSYVSEGSYIIIGGRTWRVVGVGDNITVEPAREPGTVPQWIGEEIPVPFEVAQEVGKLRRDIYDGNYDVLKNYPLTERAKDKIIEYIEGQKPFPIATDREIVVEDDGERVVINACFGSRTNETLGKILGTLLSARIGETVAVRCDPYRIILISGLRKGFSDMVYDAILSLAEDAVAEIVKRAVATSSAFKWNFVHVARKFGIIRKDAVIHNIDKIIDLYRDSVVFEEAIQRYIWNYMDIESTKNVVRRICAEDIKVVRSKISPIGMAGYDTRAEVVFPRRLEGPILDAVKKRLENQVLILVCTRCCTARRYTVGSAPSTPRCMKCGSVMIAAIPPRDRDKIALLRKKRLSKDERAEVSRIVKSAMLVRNHGKKALLALAGRGIGPDTAARILRGYYRNDREFIREILRAEINYARTKKFWD